MKLKTLRFLIGIALLSVSIPALAQTTGKIHGRVTDPTGLAKKDGNVFLTTDGGLTLSKTPCPVNENGDFTCDGIKPGTYSVVYDQPGTAPGKLTDIIDNVKIGDGEDVLVNIDMSRKAYLDKMTPEERKKVEEFAKKNAEVSKTNALIKNLNADLQQVRADNRDKKYADAEALMLKDTAVTPAPPQSEMLWFELGRAQAGLKKYDDAVVSLKKTLDLATTSKKPSPELIGGAYELLGQVYAQSGKADDAAAQYDLAAKTNPAKAPTYYSNEAAIFSNAGNADAQGAAADKAIAADPKNPLPYYLKAQSLIGKASFDSKTNQMVLPPGCEEAYKKYLELDPNGRYANDVKSILAQASTKVETKIKNAKK